MALSFASLISFFFPPAGIVMGYWSVYKYKFNWKTIAFCFALFMAAIAYAYVPYGDPDLVRYFDYVDQLKGLSFGDAIGRGMRGESNLTVFAAICWLVGKIGDSHLLPAVTVFVIYYIGIYVTCIIAEDLKVSKNTLAAYITFILLCPNFYAIMNNIRNVFCFCIVGMAVFRDCYQKKRDIWTLLMYVVPIFIHPSSLVMILLRFLIVMTGRFKVISFLLILGVKPAIDFLYSLVGYIPNSSVFTLAVRDAIVRAYRYFNDTNSVWGLIVQNSGSQRAMRYLYITLAIVICINAAVLSRKKLWDRIAFDAGIDKYERKIKRMVDYAFTIGLMTIACAPMLTPEYWRFVSALIMFSGAIFFVNKKCFSGTIIGYLNYSIFLFVIPCMLLWMRELRTSDLTVLLLQPFIGSPLIVALKDIVNMLVGG